MNVKDRHVIVTGAGAGIGLGIVRQCLAAGAIVTGFDIKAASKAGIEKMGARFTHVDVVECQSALGIVRLSVCRTTDGRSRRWRHCEHRIESCALYQPRL